MGRDLKPPDARVTFYEAICLAKLGREDEAEKTSKTALAQAKEDPKLKEEIENFIPQIAMAAISEQLSNARKAMDQSNWAEAISYLEEAESISPKTVLVLFYLTVCHFRLEQWSEAQEYALAALLLCKEKNKEIKEQLNIILEQLDIAPIKDELDKAQKAIQGEHWNAALPHIDSVLLTAPENPVALFFQALCYFKLERWDEAEESAREALRHTNKKEHENIESQLNTLLKNLVGARKAKSIGPIVELINKGNLSGALKKVEKALEEDSYNPDLHFFRAVCTFRQTMDSINSKKVTPSTSMFDDIDYDLSIAESSSDYSISSQAASLKNNVENVKQQIRSAGYW